MNKDQDKLDWWLERLERLEAERIEIEQSIKTARDRVKLYSQE